MFCSLWWCLARGAQGSVGKGRDQTRTVHVKFWERTMYVVPSLYCTVWYSTIGLLATRQHPHGPILSRGIRFIIIWPALYAKGSCFIRLLFLSVSSRDQSGASPGPSPKVRLEQTSSLPRDYRGTGEKYYRLRSLPSFRRFVLPPSFGCNIARDMPYTLFRPELRDAAPQALLLSSHS